MHNDRTQETKNAIFDDEENYISIDGYKAIELLNFEIKKRTKAYIANHPNRKKLHAKTITHFSAILNLNENHYAGHVKKICDYLEDTLDTKILQYVIHKDEGHHLNHATDVHRTHQAQFLDEYEIKNYHAHIEFIGIDSKGSAIRQKLSKQYLYRLQDNVAELLNMSRGVSSEITDTQEFYNKILKEMPETNTLIEFKEAFKQTGKKVRDRDYPKAKRKKTQHFKDIKNAEAATLYAKDLEKKIKQLQNQNNKLVKEKTLLEKKHDNLVEKWDEKVIPFLQSMKDKLNLEGLNVDEVVVEIEASVETMKNKYEDLKKEKDRYQEKFKNASNEFHTKILPFLERMKIQLNSKSKNLGSVMIEIEEKFIELLKIEKSFHILEESLHWSGDEDGFYSEDGFVEEEDLSLGYTNIQFKHEDKEMPEEPRSSPSPWN